MHGCFGPSKSTRRKYEIESLRQTLRSRDGELARLRQQEAVQKQKDAQQTEALQAAAAHVAQLEARLQAEKHERTEQLKMAEQRRQQTEARLHEEYSQKLAEERHRAELQRQQLEAQLQEEQRRFSDYKATAELQREELQTQLIKERNAREEERRLADQQRQDLEVRLAEETQKRTEQEQIVKQQNRVHAHMQRQLAAEEQRSRRLQKQISSFTETMEEVNKVLTAVEHDSKGTNSPVMVDRRARPSVADQLRQSLALYIRVKEDEVHNDQGKVIVAGSPQLA